MWKEGGRGKETRKGGEGILMMVMVVVVGGAGENEMDGRDVRLRGAGEVTRREKRGCCSLRGEMNVRDGELQGCWKKRMEMFMMKRVQDMFM